MKVISASEIERIGISPLDAYDWVEDVFRHKRECILPPKISMKNEEHRFYNTMPCELPFRNVFGVKEVNRYPGRTPSLDSKILLYDLGTGRCKALMDGNLITAVRTGAVAALAVETLARKDYCTLGMMGLGLMARHTLRVLLAQRARRHAPVLMLNLYRYKDHAEKIAQEFAGENVEFRFFDSPVSMIRESDVVVSCVTYADGPIAPDDAFRPGCLVVPVHTRGFQNCDLFFDKVFADDRGHVEGFRYFDRFRSFAELGDVLNGIAPGRESDEERILSYNIGIAAHDMYFAQNLYDRCGGLQEIDMEQ